MPDGRSDQVPPFIRDSELLQRARIARLRAEAARRRAESARLRSVAPISGARSPDARRQGSLTPEARTGPEQDPPEQAEHPVRAGAQFRAQDSAGARYSAATDTERAAHFRAEASRIAEMLAVQADLYASNLESSPLHENRAARLRMAAMERRIAGIERRNAARLRQPGFELSDLEPVPRLLGDPTDGPATTG